MTSVSKFYITDDIFQDNDVGRRNKYKCPLCGYLLKEAVQTSCGHWLCQDCGDELFMKSGSRPTCPREDCGEELEIEDGKQYFPDKFVRKDIGKFQVRCLYHTQGCLWTGTLLQLTEHITNCTYTLEECEHCHQQFEKSKLDDHIMTCPKALVYCPFTQYGCELSKQMTRAECDQHLKDEVTGHLKIVASLLKKLQLMQVDTRNEYSSSDHLTALESPPVALVRGNPQSNAGSASLSRRVESDGSSNLVNYKPGEVSPEEPIHKSELQLLEKQLTAKESQIRHLQDKLQQVEATLLTKTTENEDRDFRLSLMENSNYDGTMVWKVPQFTQRMEDARTGKFTSIFSLPFYSGRYGYKMCLRLYILGDGIGKGSHMSLFFVLMKGEFDNILQWPFTHKVTFKLINQCGGRDVVDIFQPDPLSSSFQKPKTDMNIASGCPRFVSLTELMQNGFIVDDTIFIKVKVNLATIKHP